MSVTVRDRVFRQGDGGWMAILGRHGSHTAGRHWQLQQDQVRYGLSFTVQSLIDHSRYQVTPAFTLRCLSNIRLPVGLVFKRFIASPAQRRSGRETGIWHRITRKTRLWHFGRINVFVLMNLDQIVSVMPSQPS